VVPKVGGIDVVINHHGTFSTRIQVVMEAKNVICAPYLSMEWLQWENQSDAPRVWPPSCRPCNILLGSFTHPSGIREVIPCLQCVQLLLHPGASAWSHRGAPVCIHVNTVERK
jgi:hypothetical protein